MLGGLGYYWLSITDQENRPGKGIPVDVVQKYLISDIKGFVSNSQIVGSSWQNVVNILNKVGVVLPYQLSENDALEIFDFIGHCTCIKHKINDCDTCHFSYRHAQSLSYGFLDSPKFAEFFIENESFKKCDAWNMANDPTRKVDGNIFHTPIGMIQIYYRRHINHNRNISVQTVDSYIRANL